MQFLALIYAGEGKDDVDMETLISQYESFEEEAKNVVLGSNALEAVSTATSVRVRDGKSHLT
ncbi:MAG: YciI family protein, partial [Paraglaciecola sp.]